MSTICYELFLFSDIELNNLKGDLKKYQTGLYWTIGEKSINVTNSVQNK